MAVKKTNYQQCVTILTQLHKDHPTIPLGTHLSNAFSDYGNTWGMSDKEVLFALQKYKTQLELDYFPDNDIEKIVKEGMDLDNILLEEDDDEY
jgi:hypothetical protein